MAEMSIWPSDSLTRYANEHRLYQDGKIIQQLSPEVSVISNERLKVLPGRTLLSTSSQQQKQRKKTVLVLQDE